MKQKISKLEIENHSLKLEEARLISEKNPLYLDISEMYNYITTNNYNSFVLSGIIELTNQLMKQESVLKNKSFSRDTTELK